MMYLCIDKYKYQYIYIYMLLHTQQLAQRNRLAVPVLATSRRKSFLSCLLCRRRVSHGLFQSSILDGDSTRPMTRLRFVTLAQLCLPETGLKYVE